MHENPSFIIIHAFLVLGIIYSYFVTGLELTVIIMGVSVYAVLMMIFLLSWSMTKKYYCRECKTETDIEYNVIVGWYDARPERETMFQRRESKWRHRGIVTLIGSVCSIVLFILYFVR